MNFKICRNWAQQYYFEMGRRGLHEFLVVFLLIDQRVLDIKYRIKPFYLSKIFYWSRNRKFVVR